MVFLSRVRRSRRRNVTWSEVSLEYVVGPHRVAVAHLTLDGTQNVVDLDTGRLRISLGLGPSGDMLFTRLNTFTVWTCRDAKGRLQAVVIRGDAGLFDLRLEIDCSLCSEGESLRLGERPRPYSLELRNKATFSQHSAAGYSEHSECATSRLRTRHFS